MQTSSPPEEIRRYDVPHSPVRDPDALGPTEDLDREPDGAPHSVIGLTAFFSVLLAMLVGFLFVSRKPVDMAAAVLLVIIAVPVIVSTLRKKAERDRDHLHPSR
jgi:hypothetical protein